MKKLIIAANMVFFSASNPIFANIPLQQTVSDKPMKVTFHGVYKIPDHEIYTILKGIKTPIKESSEVLIEPNSSIVLRVVNTKTNQIVAREKVMYMNVATDLVFETLQGQNVLYKRKVSVNAVANSNVPANVKSTTTASKPSNTPQAASKTNEITNFVKPKPGTFPEKDGIRSGKGVYEEKAPTTTVPNKKANSVDKATPAPKVSNESAANTNHSTKQSENLDPRATLTKINMPKAKEEPTQKVGNLGVISAKPIIIKRTTKTAPATKAKSKQ